MYYFVVIQNGRSGFSSICGKSVIIIVGYINKIYFRRVYEKLSY